MTLAGSYGSLASHIPATATDSSINVRATYFSQRLYNLTGILLQVDESEDVIILGKTLQETDTPLNPDVKLNNV